jgi:hypothetical protein
LFDAVLADAGISLIWNQRHLLRALREFEAFYNHRPHQGIAGARPLLRLPSRITDRNEITHLDIRRHQRLGGKMGNAERTLLPRFGPFDLARSGSRVRR